MPQTWGWVLLAVGAVFAIAGVLLSLRGASGGKGKTTIRLLGFEASVSNVHDGVIIATFGLVVIVLAYLSASKPIPVDPIIDHKSKTSLTKLDRTVEFSCKQIGAVSADGAVALITLLGEGAFQRQNAPIVQNDVKGMFPQTCKVKNSGSVRLLNVSVPLVLEYKAVVREGKNSMSEGAMVRTVNMDTTPVDLEPQQTADIIIQNYSDKFVDASPPIKFHAQVLGEEAQTALLIPNSNPEKSDAIGWPPLHTAILENDGAQVGHTH